MAYRRPPRPSADHRGAAGLRVADDRALPKRIVIRPEQPRHRLVDDHDAVALGSVRMTDSAAAHHRRADRREVIVTDGADVWPATGSRRQRVPPGKLEVDAEPVAEGRSDGERRVLDARSIRDPIAQFAPKIILASALGGSRRR